MKQTWTETKFPPHVKTLREELEELSGQRSNGTEPWVAGLDAGCAKVSAHLRRCAACGWDFIKINFVSIAQMKAVALRLSAEGLKTSGYGFSETGLYVSWSERSTMFSAVGHDVAYDENWNETVTNPPTPAARVSAASLP